MLEKMFKLRENNTDVKTEVLFSRSLNIFSNIFSPPLWLILKNKFHCT